MEDATSVCCCWWRLLWGKGGPYGMVVESHSWTGCWQFAWGKTGRPGLLSLTDKVERGGWWLGSGSVGLGEQFCFLLHPSFLQGKAGAWMLREKGLVVISGMLTHPPSFYSLQLLSLVFSLCLGTSLRCQHAGGTWGSPGLAVYLQIIEMASSRESGYLGGRTSVVLSSIGVPALPRPCSQILTNFLTWSSNSIFPVPVGHLTFSQLCGKDNFMSWKDIFLISVDMSEIMCFAP